MSSLRHDALVRHLSRHFPEGIPREILMKAARAQMRGETLTIALADQWIQELRDPSPPEPTRRTHYDRQPDSLVYYLRFGPFVKIGTTTNLHQRMQAIPHDELLATEPGGRDVERQRHAEFRALRHTGEWFHYRDALRAHVETVRAA